MQPSLVPGDIKEKNIVFASRRRMVRWRIIALLIFAVTIQVQSQLDSNGFLSIDCGLPTNSSYVDNATSIKYVSDEQFIDTGNNSEISTNYSREFNTLRYFPTGTRNCYTMRSLTVGLKYLIRAGFYYGNYDNKNKPPIFDIYFGINFWNTMDPSSSLQYEIIVNATTDYLEFCLVNTGNGDPYISWLHLRQVNSPYPTVNSTQSLHMIKRLNIGGGNQQLVMYPDDINDLWWSSYSDTGWKEISTNSTIQPDPDLQTPSVVMQTAATTSSTQQPLNIIWNSNDKSTKYYFILRFYEIRTSSTGRREFNVLVNGFKAFPESIILDPQNPWDFSTHRRSGYTNYTVSLVATSNSTLPPLINAFELHKVAPVGVPTYSADVAAINSVKKYHNIKKGWTGDPCLPSQFLWTGITCTTDSSNNARITGLNLSSNSLTGPLSNSIGNLTALEFLNLSNNDLSGSLPSSLDNIKALKLLDIRENPNISTALPPELDKKQKNRSLDYRFEGMNWMPSPRSPKKKIIIIAVGVGVPLLVLVVIATFIWLKRREYVGSVAYANDLTLSETIYSFTTILIPLKTKPNYSQISEINSPPAPPSAPSPPPSPQSPPPSLSLPRTPILIGASAFAALLIICAAGVYCWRLKPTKQISTTTNNEASFNTSSQQMVEQSLTCGSSGDCNFSLTATNNEASFNTSSQQMVEQSLTCGSSGDCPKFLLSELKSATCNFSEDNKLGQGGFGLVYKGVLPNGDLIAVKRLAGWSKQGYLELKNEVKLLAKLEHENLVKLHGYCLERNEKLLCYEYLPCGSLDRILFADEIKRNKLSWETRCKILEGICCGLQYLHGESELKIVHRDLKPSNILLDEHMNPKISDFGLAKLYNDDQTHMETSKIAGTHGYMAPEYAMQGMYSEKLDVYSFGVLLLEIATGRKNSSFFNNPLASSIASYARQHWEKGKVEVLKDPVLDDACLKQLSRCLHIGLLCVQENPNNRPNMGTVSLLLQNDSITIPALTRLPNRMDFSLIEGSMNISTNDDMPNHDNTNYISAVSLKLETTHKDGSPSVSHIGV